MERIQITPLLDTLRLEKISDSEYFSDHYKNYISNSRLSLINPTQGGSREKFFKGFQPIYSSSLDLGSTVHQMCLQSEYFTICNEVNKPTAKVGVIADKHYPNFNGEIPSKEDICKIATEIDYYHGILSDKQYQTVIDKCMPYWASRHDFEQSYTGVEEVIYLDPKTRETASACITALNNNKSVQKILHPDGLIETPISENEQAILLDVEVKIPESSKTFVLRLKSKLDNYTIDKESNTICVNDIKTLGRILSEFSTNVDRYRYNRELSMYSFLLGLCAKKFYNMDSPKVKGNYLVVSTIPQYYSKVVPMTKKDFLEGWNEFKTLLRMVAQAVYEEYPEFAIWNQVQVILYLLENFRLNIVISIE